MTPPPQTERTNSAVEAREPTGNLSKPGIRSVLRTVQLFWYGTILAGQPESVQARAMQSDSPDIAMLCRDRVPALDGIRGIAILLVLICHLAQFMRRDLGMWSPYLEQGRAGVDLFFVLSGFLITGVLLDTKGSPVYFQSFYWRRFLRIFPLYYAVLCVILSMAAGNGWFVHILAPRANWKLYLLYISNWRPLPENYPNILAHFWSLAVEEQFYLIWPFVIWLIPKNRIVPVVLCGIIAAFLLRTYLLVNYGDIRAIYENTFCRMDDLLFGSLAAYAVRSPTLLKKAKPYTGIAGSVAAAIAFLGEVLAGRPFLWSLGFTCWGIAFCAFVLHAFETRDTGSPMQRALRTEMLRIFGKYSYGIYILHVPLFSVIAFMGFTPAVYVYTTVCSTALIATVGYECFEKRFLNLKQYVGAGTAGSCSKSASSASF